MSLWVGLMSSVDGRWVSLVGGMSEEELNGCYYDGGDEERVWLYDGRGM